MGVLSDAANIGSNLANALSGSRQGSYSQTDNTFRAMYNYNRMQERMAFNRKEAQKNRDFQERMASTQYQRAVDDLKKAGLNPILAYTNGGNSAPSGSGASSSRASIGADAMSSSFGIRGLAEGVGQIMGAMEGLGFAPNDIKQMWKQGIGAIGDALGISAGKDLRSSRSGGFGGNSRGGSFDNFGGSAKGGSFRG